MPSLRDDAERLGLTAHSSQQSTSDIDNDVIKAVAPARAEMRCEVNLIVCHYLESYYQESSLLI